MRRFEIREGQDGLLLISDQESGYEAELVVLGNFASEAHRQEYAEALAQALNAAAVPTREFSKYDDRGRLRPERKSLPDDSLSAYALAATR